MEKYQETFKTWDKVAKLYEDKFMYLDLYNDTYDLFLNSVTVDKAKILDIGCGPGNISGYLLYKRADLNILGIDISPNMVKIARKNNPNAKFATMDSRRISDLPEKYDGIISGFCLPYLSGDDSAQLIFDCSNLLIAGGSLYLSFVEGNPQESGFIKGSSGDRMFFYYHSLKELKKHLSKNGFKEIQVLKIDYQKSETGGKETHTILIAKKNTGAD